MAVSRQMLNQLAFALTIPKFQQVATPMQKAMAVACYKNRKDARRQPNRR